jgi:homoserine dehydrogenase
MSKVEVLKFGSSVLRAPADLHVAVDEIYRRWRSGRRVIAVVSAFEGVTDALMADVADIVGTECPEAMAAYVATGEGRTAALLQGSLHQYGLPSRLVSPREIGLVAEGPLLESMPIHADAIVLGDLHEIARRHEAAGDWDGYNRQQGHGYSAPASLMTCKRAT